MAAKYLKEYPSIYSSKYLEEKRGDVAGCVKSKVLDSYASKQKLDHKDHMALRTLGLISMHEEEHEEHMNVYEGRG